MRSTFLSRLAIVAFSLGSAVSLGAQQTQATAPAAPVGPAVGEMAPEFEFTGITRYGVLRDRQKLSDFRGSTVVLVFFPKARTKG
jgi:hypothetical protein